MNRTSLRREQPLNQPIVFLHIPKTAGSSISSALANSIVGAPVETGFDRYLYGGFDRFETFSPEVRKSLYLTVDEMPRGDFVSGHYAFSTIATAYPHGRYITVLREPRARLLSHWTFWRSIDDVLLTGAGDWASYVKKARGSLFDFLSDPEIACQTDNLVTRALTWPHHGAEEGRFIAQSRDGEVLDAARSTLSCFSFVGLVEDCGLGASLSDWLATPIDIPTVNETQVIPPDLTLDLTRELTPACLALLRERTRLDCRLWAQVATARFGDQASALWEDTQIRTIAKHTRLLLGVS